MTTPTTPSVQLYSLREAMASDVAGTVGRLAELGIQLVEPYAFHLATDEYRQAFASAGVSAPSGHAAVIDSQAPEAIFDAAATLGISTVIDPFVPTARWQTASQVGQLADRANELSALAGERGLRFGYHNHAWEIANRIGDSTALDAFVAQLEPAVVLEVDTYWATVGGADVVALLAALGERVQLIHVKDGTRDGDVQRQQPAGQGEIDVTGILRAAPQALRVIEFDAYAGDVFEGIAASQAWLAENDQ